ncbi:uncharacterized protein LOC101850267 isoform X3 [Aplysia californica]|uniref:Uncharacterized protein LOC101850267 isoform X3 n=1 Tax=Aplysia californica TaxID=6500 RepID=A0ABM0JXQ9_APLCA|nr:uncharacterized protein LOC101850267 isoform X3 [Aplysia californica]
MRKKISPGLIATSGDGKPSIHPRVPAHWSGQPSVSSGSEKDDLKPSNSSLQSGQAASLSAPSSMEEPAGTISRDPSPLADGAAGGYISTDPQTPSSSSNHMSATESTINSNGEPLSTQENASESISEPMPSSSSYFQPVSDSLGLEKEQVDVVSAGGEEMAESAGSESSVVPGYVASSTREVKDDNPENEMSTAQYAENERVECCTEVSSHQTVRESSAEEREETVDVMDDDTGTMLTTERASQDRELDYELACQPTVTEISEFCAGGRDKASDVDLVSMTIASVAAGEGEPPRCSVMPLRDQTYGEERAPGNGNNQHHSISSSASNKHKKHRGEKNSMSASARLPVISSLLAPSGAGNPQQSTQLPGIQHIASAGRSSSSPTTALPSVAHFLGPAKSPQNTFKPVTPGVDPYSSAMAAADAAGDSSHGGTPYQTSKSKNNRKPVTPAGLRLSLAASEELPDPLPIPQYSEKVQRAKQLGTVAFDRPTVLRETVQFFLQFKHYWSSHDYDRISNLVVELFPEFKDNNEMPGVPANKRIRTDLSMYARNFRRREVSQRKKEGIMTSPAGEHSKDPSLKLSSPYGHPTSPSANGNPGNVGSNNASDFCNELLTAASIIESQNCPSGVRNDLHESGPSKGRAEESLSGTPEMLRHKHGLSLEGEGRTPSNGEPHRKHGELPDDETDDTPIHFVYDKEQMTPATRDANTAWQLYSDQVAQMASSSVLDYGMTTDEAAATPSSSSPAAASSSSNTDRLSAMAMWRSTALPDPLPTPPYSDSVIRARESGNTMSARPKIIRETTQYFLALKLWWTAPDYERIAELVLQNFPALVSLQAIKKDLGTCARNMRRRLPAAKYKPSSATQKAWVNSQTGLEQSPSEGGGGNHPHQALSSAGTAEYMKALMAAQNMNLTELSMTQRNLGELAVLAGIKQRIEQHPQDVTDLERQYLAQCTSEEQRQALMASGAFGNDAAAMAALSAFYGQLGVDITGGGGGGGTNNVGSGSSSGGKRSLMAGEYNSSHSSAVQEEGLGHAGGDMSDMANSKRQRRISQAEVEKRLREAELSHQHHTASLSSGGADTSAAKGHHQLSVGVSDSSRPLVKREPMSPSGTEAGAGSKSAQGTPKQSHQHLTVPNPMAMFPANAAHEHAAYWDAQAAANMALMGVASMAHSVPSTAPVATLAHSQAHVQHLAGHEVSASDVASTEAPMNLAYHHDADKPEHNTSSTPPLPTDPLPDTASLAAQVEVTTSSMKSTSRRRASSSPRSAHNDSGISSRDQQVWFPHGSGFKKENQEVVCLPEPLPVPVYSQKILAARSDGSSMRHRSEIIRETARFFLGLKHWWSSADYTRISELVVQQFPDLKDDNTADGMTNYRRIQRDLSMCARNLRRSKKPRKIRDLTGDAANSMSDPTMPREITPKKAKSKLSSEKKKKQGSGLSKLKKNKQHHQEALPAVVTEPAITAGVNEDMTAAAALLQQQFMQSNGSTVSSFHPSSHLLPSAHLLPPLHTHPALHEQQMQAQLHNSLVQQQQQQQQQQQVEEQHSVTVEEPQAARKLVKEEPPSTSADTTGNYESSMKSASAVAAISKPCTPTMETGHVEVEAGEVPAQATRSSHSREMEDAALVKADQEKIGIYQPAQNTKKTYVDPDHGSDLQTKFANLWQRGKFFDASLGVANKKLHVHKLILLAMSPYLQETFKNADPRSQLEVNLPSDTTYETAKAFLRYIYEGVLEVDTMSVRSLYKIATMLQMTKLAQYCQNFAQLLQEEAEEANGGAVGEGEIPKISVNLGELTEVQVQRQRILEAQALQRLGETTTISSAEHQRNMSRYQNGEDQSQHKTDLMGTEHNPSDPSGSSSAFLSPELLAHHRALVAVTSAVQSSSATSSSSLLLSSSQDTAAQQLFQAAMVRNQTSSPTPSTSSPSYYSHLHHQPATAQPDSAVLLHRFTSPDSTLPPAPSSSSSSSSSFIEHQRLAVAAYWQAQAHTLGEMMSRGQVGGLAPETATELAAIAAAAAATNTEDGTRHLLSSLGCHDGGSAAKVKVPSVHPVVNSRASHHHHHHHSRDPSPSWGSQVAMETDSGAHQPTMLPETCIPVDMARSHHVTNSEGHT